MVRDHGRAEAMASTTARGSARARAIVAGSMMGSGAEGTTRRRGRGRRGGGARVKGAIGVFALGALVKGAFGQTYVDYVRQSPVHATSCRKLLAPVNSFD
jgi:hypothetical protein